MLAQIFGTLARLIQLHSQQLYLPVVRGFLCLPTIFRSRWQSFWLLRRWLPFGCRWDDFTGIIVNDFADHLFFSMSAAELVRKCSAQCSCLCALSQHLEWSF